MNRISFWETEREDGYYDRLITRCHHCGERIPYVVRSYADRECLQDELVEIDRTPFCPNCGSQMVDPGEYWKEATLQW